MKMKSTNLKAAFAVLILAVANSLMDPGAGAADLLTVNNTGTLLLAGIGDIDRVNSASVDLAGGTMSMAGRRSSSKSLEAPILSANSISDFSNGNGATIHFASSLVRDTGPGISFGGAPELAPMRVPSTIYAGAALLGLAAWRMGRRLVEKKSWAKKNAEIGRSEEVLAGWDVEGQKRHYAAEFVRLTPMVLRLLTDIGAACHGRFRFISRNFDIGSYPRKGTGVSQWSLSGPNHPIGHKQWLVVELSRKSPQGGHGFRVRLNRYELASTGLSEADLKRTLTDCVRSLIRSYEYARRHPSETTEGDAVIRQDDRQWERNMANPHSLEKTKALQEVAAALGNSPGTMRIFPAPLLPASCC